MMDHEKNQTGRSPVIRRYWRGCKQRRTFRDTDRIARMCEQIYGGLYEDAGYILKNSSMQPTTIW